MPSVLKSGSLNPWKLQDMSRSVTGLLFIGFTCVNPLTPNDHYSGRTAPLTSKRCILYIYSTNIGTEYFKHGIYSPFFSLQNAVCFIILKYLVPVLFTFYIQCVLKLKKNNSGAKRLILSRKQHKVQHYKCQYPCSEVCLILCILQYFGKRK